jgi:hypothetical protein
MRNCSSASPILNSGTIPCVGKVRVENDCLVCVMADTKIARHRTTRVHIAIPVFIYGNNESGPPFKEITQTVAVNANGCLVELATPVVKEQPLLLMNLKTNEELTCTVVTLGNIVNGKTEVGLRFAQPSPRFWGIGFPPEDWDPNDRKRPMPPKR